MSQNRPRICHRRNRTFGRLPCRGLPQRPPNDPIWVLWCGGSTTTHRSAAFGHCFGRFVGLSEPGKSLTKTIVTRSRGERNDHKREGPLWHSYGAEARKMHKTSVSRPTNCESNWIRGTKLFPVVLCVFLALTLRKRLGFSFQLSQSVFSR